jgi:hypothetical protein
MPEQREPRSPVARNSLKRACGIAPGDLSAGRQRPRKSTAGVPGSYILLRCIHAACSFFQDPLVYIGPAQPEIRANLEAGSSLRLSNR